MAWQKAPQGLIDLFTESLPRDARVDLRKMFGYPCAFVNGNMAAGLFGDGLFLRLSPEDRAALGAQPFEPMPGRPMKDYSALPDDVIADEERLAQLLARAIEITASLPPKVKKPAKGKATFRLPPDLPLR
jgi:TfoX/Sxy family transcriptional regulator of competence genes